MKREIVPKNARRKGATAAATRGVHHLALNTEDMRMTVDFYARIVGMPLVHARKVPAVLGTGLANRGNPPYERIRHYFFDMGNDSLLAFFEIPRGAEPPGSPKRTAGRRTSPFAVTVQNFEALQKRLRDAGVAYDGPIDILPGLVSIYFFDPNGIRLEACCEPAKAEKPGVVESVRQTRAEARAELQSVDRGWATTTIAQGGFK